MEQPPSDPPATDPAAGETISKSALKREIKKRENEEKKRIKEEERARRAAEMRNANENRPAAADEEDMEPTQYLENRLKYLATEKEEGRNPYPHKFSATMTIKQYIKEYRGLSDGQHRDDVSVSLTGTYDLCYLLLQVGLLIE